MLLFLIGFLFQQLQAFIIQATWTPMMIYVKSKNGAG